MARNEIIAGARSICCTILWAAIKQNYVVGPAIGPHGRAQNRNDFRSKKLPAYMAPSDDWGHVCARSRLDPLLNVCICEVGTPRRPLKAAVMFEAGLEIGFMREPRPEVTSIEVLGSREGRIHPSLSARSQ